MIEDSSTLKVIDLDGRENTKIQLWSELDELKANLRHIAFIDKTEPISSPACAQNNISMLLVDDSKTIRAQFGTILRKQGYSVDVSESPEQAFQMARDNHYDIAIVDYYMPEHNGADLCRKLRGDPRTSHMDLAVLTGSYDNALVADVLDSGAVECMFKTESSQLFVSRVETMAKRCEQKRSLEHEKSALDNILKSVGDGVYGVDKEGWLTFINPAAVRMLGFESDVEMLGESAHQVFHHSSAELDLVDPNHCFLHQAYLLGDKLEHWETTFWSSKTVAVPVECSLMPLHAEGVHVGSVVAFKDISERLLFEEELKWQINHDHLTQLLNRQYLEQAMEKEFRRLARSDEKSAVLFIDLDRFKQINDLAGHAAGDKLLIEISGKLKERVRSSDILARVSGDEFVVVLHSVDIEQALFLAESFREILDQTIFTYGDKTFDVTGSIGVALIDAKSVSYERVLANADAACHMAKNKGRNQIHIFDEGRDESSFDRKGRGWIERIAVALDKGYFQLMFQPVYTPDQIRSLCDKSGGKFTQSKNNLVPDSSSCEFYEVLLRLCDNQQNDSVLPQVFLPSAERLGLMWNIDIWVLRQVAKLMHEKHRLGNKVSFSVNVSGQTILNEEFEEALKGVLSEFEVPSGSLLIEIKESSVVASFSKMVAQFEVLEKLGVQIVLDGIGMGYSSFSNLQNIKVDIAKVNGSLIRGIASDPIDRTIVKTINDISQILNRRTVAQHVDSDASYKQLELMNFNYLQGHYLTEPLSVLP